MMPLHYMRQWQDEMFGQGCSESELHFAATAPFLIPAVATTEKIPARSKCHVREWAFQKMLMCTISPAVELRT
jgi:hypothetical protein